MNKEQGKKKQLEDGRREVEKEKENWKERKETNGRGKV
jgi:hypothetical protein